jgi:hypothetical protein
MTRLARRALTHFVSFEAEAWLGKRLRLTGPLALFSGTTDAGMRRERIRKAIIERGPEKVCAHKNGKDITYGEAFQQLYGEPVNTNTSG